MKNIIFLDIDGVINIYSDGSDKFGNLFNASFVSNLGEIVERTNAKIVITST